MRPTRLDPLFAPVTKLPGIGPKTAKTLGSLLVGHAEREARISDLLFHLPTSMIDRRLRPGVSGSPEGTIVTLTLCVDQHRPPPRNSRAPYKVFAHDETGSIELVFFHARRDYLEKILPVGETRLVSGKVEWFNDRAQMVHPDYVVSEEDAKTLPVVEPVYPLTAGLSGRMIIKAMQLALKVVPDLPEWQDAKFLDQQGFPSFKDALLAVHHPEDASDLVAEGKAVRRLAYDEYLANQLALALVRNSMRHQGGTERRGDGQLRARIRAALPFNLTEGQEQALIEISEDLDAPVRMLRLLQGDVGSGKTVVGLMAMAQVIESGAQAALMAPTDILARQHYASILPLCEAAGIRAAVMSGKDTAKTKREINAALAAGELDLIVGTHALFQTTVTFKNLGLAVVDEQHRFGVHQRLSLSSKGAHVDVLVMTATPIPRTLVLSYFGDMEVSRLTDKPEGRQPIKTVAVSLDRISEVVERLRAAIQRGEKAYWVCPLVEESEKIDLAAAQERFEDLQRSLGPVVSLVHGRQSADEKQAAMDDFKHGRTRLLVATTVIEVGVDVPDATIIVIEHSERFGLAQLHQLRGRVGRGSAASTCLLLYKAPLGETSAARLSILRETNDGFRIAEEDLRLRGEGELLGTRQSGMPGFKIANVEAHGDLMEIARDDAKLILSRDPALTSPRGDALRHLLYLFSRDEAVRLLRAG
ncbi:ATP-dependent DNA helicase RecG [Pseudovibrio exalbescens]|uniref:ATP-dependent DNA helicase RecG n=1 Tax=Pseudovibrio exalbescens TaxID=197461 RepID=A0A1U7JFN9_9HYPH|nr:ATP-dependent DNA helicase RecG [Pseudovibrio exalbescens]OKL43504.1 ATP-dependent DNA helicase RecG [Pseudovibrio exalbescens]